MIFNYPRLKIKVEAETREEADAQVQQLLTTKKEPTLDEEKSKKVKNK
jgi:hypothetical protein